MKRVGLSVEDSFFCRRGRCFLQFQNFAFEIEFESESSLRFTAQVYGQIAPCEMRTPCLRAKMIQKLAIFARKQGCDKLGIGEGRGLFPEKMEYRSKLRLAEPARVDGRSSSAAKAADSSYGVLTTRNPMTLRKLSGERLLKRCDARQPLE